MGGLPTQRTVNGFAVNPDNPKMMYAAMRDGLFQSTDGGERWKPVGSGLRNMAGVVINPKRALEAYAVTQDGRLYLSADGGKMWSLQR